MAKSLLDQLSAEEFGLIKASVYYDPKSLHGLRWANESYSRSGRGHSANDPVARNFFVGKHSYQTAQIVLILNNIWPDNGKDVVTRKSKTGLWSDVSNLIWSSRGEARSEGCESRRVELVKKILGFDEPDLGKRYRLNRLCQNMHTWNDYNLSLQRKDGQEWKCEKCEKARKSMQSRQGYFKERYQRNADSEREKARARMAKRLSDPIEREKQRERSRICNANRRAQKGRESRAKGIDGLMLPPGVALSVKEASAARDLVSEGYPMQYEVLKPLIEDRMMLADALQNLIKGQTGGMSVAELVKKEQERWWKENPEEYKKKLNNEKYTFHEKRMYCDPVYRENYLLYHRQKSKRRKALLRGSIGHQLTGSQVRKRFEQFGHTCAYCGKGGDLHIEHVVPVSKGGTHVLGNIVPACPGCNFNKAAREVESWYRAQSFFCEKRWRKIRRVLGVAKGSPNQLALL